MIKWYKVLFMILAGVLIFWAGGWTQEKFNRGADLFNQHHLEEGLKRYAPTRMEWLALRLNANHNDDSSITDIHVKYYAYGGDLRVNLFYKYDVKYVLWFTRQ